MKKIVALLSVLLVCVMAFSACSSGKKTTPDTDRTSAVTQAEVAAKIDEQKAKEIAFEDAGIKETAAEDLAVTEGEKKGKEVYTITFKWSGFDYEYSISKTDGEIVESIFDGEVVK